MDYKQEVANFTNIDNYSASEVSALAAKGVMPDKGMTYVSWLLWYMLRDIYNEFSAGTLTKEQGAERKRQAMEIYDRECEYLCRTLETCDRVAKMWRDVEAASTAYRKERTLENADEMMRILYGFV